MDEDNNAKAEAVTQTRDKEQAEERRIETRSEKPSDPKTEPPQYDCFMRVIRR